MRAQGFDKYGLYHMQSVETPMLREVLDLKEGLVSSGSSLDTSEEDMKLMDVRTGDLSVGVVCCWDDGCCWDRRSSKTATKQRAISPTSNDFG